jgi:hypothetical protein
MRGPKSDAKRRPKRGPLLNIICAHVWYCMQYQSTVQYMYCLVPIVSLIALLPGHILVLPICTFGTACTALEACLDIIHLFFHEGG